MPSAQTTAPAADWRRKASHISHDALSFGRWMGGKPLAKAPSAEFSTPGGGRMRLTTDRVRARPALTPQLSFMLGQNAIGLGVWGLLFPKAVNRFLGVQAPHQTTQLLFGTREMATGMSLFSNPTRSGVLWARVAGDLFDIGVLTWLNRPSNPKRGNARLALGVVLAVTALDAIAAARLSNVQRNSVSGGGR
ncbi:hypothetical protein [Phenylobacterium sp.]|uniref:hypothetical protein n=1 Tax=Phenylobacterium sp. TaxID=1871053 RepID=UPI0027316606|nr:hypothetical protein [Phenylobacterium sp.]MDP1617382.1 hypothetical protein [Phenylobacterium sp.]MDP1985924.1 hypothetical protein [Phenylobacterium sp.]